MQVYNNGFYANQIIKNKTKNKTKNQRFYFYNR